MLASPNSYTPQRDSLVKSVPLRDWHYSYREWGNSTPSSAAPLVLLHGWMDVGASFQFVVDAFSDAFAQGRRIVALDWRGFGHSVPQSGSAPDDYRIADYYADLDFFLDAVSPDQTVDLVGHSMGANIATVYAGVRPDRVRRLVNLEGFGAAQSNPAQTPKRLADWMQDLKRYYRGELDLHSYEAKDGVARRLMKSNPRISADKAAWLAGHWAEPHSDGRWHILGEAAHKIAGPLLYRWEEIQACWQAITAPTLVAVARHTSLAQWWGQRYTLDDFFQRLKSLPQYELHWVEDAGHMLHHDQPQVVAGLIETFLSAPSQAVEHV